MTTGYKELLKQRDALNRDIEQARKEAVKDALDTIKPLIQEFGLTARDLGLAPAAQAQRKGTGVPSPSKGVKVAPKYRDPQSGAVWTGRGKPPVWIKDAADREAFAIQVG